MSEQHPYQVAVDKINEIGLYKAKTGQKTYRLLHKLAKSLGIYMHGSQAYIGQTFNIKEQKMKKMATDALKQYCSSGVLQIPEQFKFNENKVYRHDGDANANRNTWNESNKAQEDKHKQQPVQYHLNTVSK
jgi:hypothetical protein